MMSTYEYENHGLLLTDINLIYPELHKNAACYFEQIQEVIIKKQ